MQNAEIFYGVPVMLLVSCFEWLRSALVKMKNIAGRLYRLNLLSTYCNEDLVLFYFFGFYFSLLMFLLIKMYHTTNYWLKEMPNLKKIKRHLRKYSKMRLPFLQRIDKSSMLKVLLGSEKASEYRILLKKILDTKLKSWKRTTTQDSCFGCI